jgi:hypothetical protein
VATADPPAGVSVKVDPVIVDAFIASLNVAVTADVMATLVLAFNGVTAVTVGAGGGAAAAVVNDQV